jgi:hypothetical protein
MAIDIQMPQEYVASISHVRFLVNKGLTVVSFLIISTVGGSKHAGTSEAYSNSDSFPMFLKHSSEEMHISHTNARTTPVVLASE